MSIEPETYLTPERVDLIPGDDVDWGKARARRWTQPPWSSSVREKKERKTKRKKKRAIEFIPIMAIERQTGIDRAIGGKKGCSKRIKTHQRASRVALDHEEKGIFS